MYGYGKVWAVKFAEPAAVTGVGILDYRNACFTLLKNLGRTESYADGAGLAPVFKNLLNKELFALFFKILFYFPIVVRIVFRVR